MHLLNYYLTLNDGGFKIQILFYTYPHGSSSPLRSARTINHQ